MKIDKTKFEKEIKKIKKHYKEQEKLDKIINHIKMCDTMEILENHSISKIYEFEPLKHELNGYYSFNLCKKGGVIRLIFTVDRVNNIVILEYISMDHYDDFKNKLK